MSRLHDQILADLDQQYARGDIDIVTWEREVRLARADAAAEARQEAADMADAAHDFHGQAC